MKIHILGICGTFMAGIAVLAKQLGYDVEGSDEKVYPPMSTQLREQGIVLKEGYLLEHLDSQPDQIIVGNVISRGNPMMEFILNKKLNFISGPQWLFENILKKTNSKNPTVIAISGTHGKTTTSSLMAHILNYAGLNPSFLIGGVPENFGISARYSKNADFFVIEADEYDSAFFDKRSKFIHYHPDLLVINNIEYDHADIFPDLKAVQTQFHYLVRTVPENGLIVIPHQDENVKQVVEKGCWTSTTTFGTDLKSEWCAKEISPEGSQFHVYHKSVFYGEVHWNLLGLHNVNNALAALAIADRVGVEPQKALDALKEFRNVKRRLEIKGCVKGVTVYDDFAHHPTAIETTVAGLRAKIGSQRLIALLELGSHTMRTGVHQARLPEVLTEVDEVYFLRPMNANWDIDAMANQIKVPHAVFNSVDDIIKNLSPRLQPHDHVLVMSNFSFGQIHDRLLKKLAH